MNKELLLKFIKTGALSAIHRNYVTRCMGSDGREQSCGIPHIRKDSLSVLFPH